MKIAVTGGGGSLGQWVIDELLTNGYQALSIDVNPPSKKVCPHLKAELNDLGQVYGALKGCDAVIHLAAIPAPVLRTPEVTFGNNAISTFNVLEAASSLGMTKAVVGSSESIYGICWSSKPQSPRYVPMDEEHPFQIGDCYALSKQTNELTCEMYHRKTGIQTVSLRFANIVKPDQYEHFRGMIDDPGLYMKNLWSYVDVRDAAAACRAAMEAEGLGAVALNITANETMAEVETMELIKRYYPALTDIREPLEGHALIYTNRKARELLNWSPMHSWRDYIRR
ncbi:NAD(P)-dependent oxidoreductase [Paenibacillus antri]|uniref:NAD(P)-dependent oxidoreductase n=1 Tax=Paenibacillus antri TaxID=2582848 RepID=A0A5R9GKA8_9BACL|nr:NAD(P)-dependent oxidoreductase [Paenibacillus antri]TLS53908.1 NAD(P)-dependent oxidoreductase [Paenibacillus antri]